MQLKPNDPAAASIQARVKNINLPGGEKNQTFKTDHLGTAYDKALAWAVPLEAALKKG